MLHLHLETNYKSLHYKQKKPVKADYPSFNERPDAHFFYYNNQRQVIASVVMNLRIAWKNGKYLLSVSLSFIYDIQNQISFHGDVNANISRHCNFPLMTNRPTDAVHLMTLSSSKTSQVALPFENKR
jgi:hypothetical protein